MLNLPNLPNLLKRKLPTDHPGIGALSGAEAEARGAGGSEGDGLGDVIRHRVRSRLHGRRLQLAAVAVAVALAGGAAANAAGPGDPPAQTSAGSAAELAEREAAAERADRSQRDQKDAGGKKPSGSKDKSGSKESSGPNDKSGPKDKSGESKKKKAKDWVHPMPGARTTSCYGARWGTMHAGVDLAAAQGTPIRAVGAGRVIGAGWLYGGYGISVVIDHGNGFVTHYAHASTAKVSVGQQVKPGQKIALEGSTGNSTGPHLHLEVHNGMWNQIEPTKWLNKRGVKIRGC